MATLFVILLRLFLNNEIGKSGIVVRNGSRRFLRNQMASDGTSIILFLVIVSGGLGLFMSPILLLSFFFFRSKFSLPSKVIN